MFHVLPLWVGAFVAPLPPLPARTGPRAALRCHASADGPAEPPELEPDLSAWRNVRHQLSRSCRLHYLRLRLHLHLRLRLRLRLSLLARRLSLSFRRRLRPCLLLAEEPL